jgi:hypothetical protein
MFDLKDGLLSLDLEREVPERLRPRMVQIGATVQNGIKSSTIDASMAAK